VARKALTKVSADELYPSAKKAFQRLSQQADQSETPERNQQYDYRSQTPYHPPKVNTDDDDEPSIGTVPFSTPRSRAVSRPIDLESLEKEVLKANAKLLIALRERDWSTYSDLSDASITQFMPESKGSLTRGLDYRRFSARPTEKTLLGDNGQNQGYKMQATQAQEIWENTVSLDCRMLGPENAVVTCERLLQRGFDSVMVVETRVWNLSNEGWKQVHVHQSYHTGTAGEHIVE